MAAASSSGSIVVRTARPGRRRALPSTRPPANSVPPGRPARRSLNTRSRPEMPTSALSGSPRARSSRRRSGGIGPSCPTTCAATSGITDTRSVPWARGWPSRASRSARGASSVRRLSRSPGATPGNVISGRQAIRTSSPSPENASRTFPRTTPKIRVRTLTDSGHDAVFQACGSTDCQRRGCGRRQRFLVGQPKGGQWRARARRRGQHPVHGRVVPALPGPREALGQALLGGDVERTHHRSGGQGQRGNRHQRPGAVGEASTAIGRGPPAQPRGPWISVQCAAGVHLPPG